MALEIEILQQVHSYRNGHSLVDSSIKLDRASQDLVDRLSDLAGPIGPGQKFAPYLTFYPLIIEPYFVVARTWQDVKAPRAGCVITRSLFVPLDVWRSGGVLRSLLSALDTAETELSRPIRIGEMSPADEELTALEPGGTTEFAEAFFLENRQPIVIFDAASPEDLTRRLVEGLWPAFRSSLAICTHAYSPRSIQGRPFDLLFSPGSARSNFSAWPGRRIDGQATDREPRHKWTASITQRLFDAPRVVPLTLSLTQLGLSGDDANESQFRLTMLWEELQQRSHESHLAILGMLDIVSSLGRADHSVVRLLDTALRNSIRLAKNLDTQSLLQYLMTLLGKFPSRMPPAGALNEIRRAAVSATAQHPEMALAVLRDWTEQEIAIPPVVAAGVANGLILEPLTTDRVAVVLSLDEVTLLSLISFGRSFTKALIETLEREGSRAGFERLTRVVATSDLKLRARARRNAIPFLRTEFGQNFLGELLREVDKRTLSASVRWLTASGGIEVPELGDCLVTAADTSAKRQVLRSLLAERASSGSIDALLAKSLTVAEDDLEWIKAAQFTPMRKGSILRDVLTRSLETDLQRIPANLADEVLEDAELATCDFPVGVLTKILRFIPGSCDVVLRIILAKPSYFLRELDVSFIQFLLGRVFGEPVSRSLALQAIDHFAPLVPARELALLPAASGLRSEQVSRNLLLFEAASEDARANLASRVDILTEQITSRRTSMPSADAVHAWAGILRESNSRASGAVSLLAASLALEFGLHSTQVQISALLRVAFPRVYAHLISTQAAPSILSFFSFYDFDRCKTARTDLVRAFINSVWPPADLLNIAVDVAEVGSICRILATAPGGYEFFARAVADPSLPTDVRIAFFGKANDSNAL